MREDQDEEEEEVQKERGIEKGEMEPRRASGDKGGPLVALIRARDGPVCADDRDFCASVSISHDTEYATAVCLGVNSLGRDVV